MTATANASYYALDAAFSFASDDTDMGDFLDRVAEHLADLGAEDVMIVADTAASTFVISLVVAARAHDSAEGIVANGMGTLRTSFHACDADTPTWPSAKTAFLSVRIDSIREEADADKNTSAKDLVSA